MPTNISLSENIGSLLDKMEQFLQSKTILSEPITVGNITMVMCTSVCFGLGSGNTEKSLMDKKGCSGTGNGAGVGVRMSPVAIIVVQDNKVQLMPISESSSMNKMIEALPEILQKLNLSPEILTTLMSKLKPEKSEKGQDKET